MKKALVFALVAVAALVLAQGAFAGCEGICVKVPGTLFCRVCEEAGYYTGAVCQQSGPCGCFYIQSTCAAGTSTEPLSFEEPVMSTVEASDMLVEQSFDVDAEALTADEVPEAPAPTAAAG